MASKLVEIANECRRQCESCLYTSTALYEWLKCIRFWKKVMTVMPLIFGSLAGSSILIDAPFESSQTLTGVLAFAAGLIPTVYLGLRLDESESEVARGAVAFKNAGNRFRQAALIRSGTIAECEAAFDDAMCRMESANELSLTAPDRFFRKAQKKVKKGDYEFEVDVSEEA